MLLIEENRTWLDEAIKKRYIRSYDYNSFEKFELIAMGGFGQVEKVYLKPARKTVVLKSLYNQEWRYFVRELQNISAVDDSDNVIRFLGISQDLNTNAYFLVFQYANGGTLRDYLNDLHKNGRFSKLKWPRKIKMAKDIANGLHCIHAANIVHRDLYSKNVLIHNNRLMITDFGLSKCQGISTSIDGRTPEAYCDPQFLNDNSYKRDKPSDIYSLGILFWEISSGKVPQIKLINIIMGEREAPVDGTPLDYVNIYSKAWQGDPSQRPTVEIILDHLEKIKLQPVTNDSFNVPEDSSIEDQREKAELYFTTGDCVKALKLWEVILRNPKHTQKDRNRASILNLWGMCLGKTGGMALAKALRKNTTLIDLNLSYNNIGESAGKALAEALCKNTTLTSLNLRHNQLGESAGKALAEALCKNTTLTELDISQNDIGESAGGSLAEALCNNTTLAYLKLYRNNIGESTGKALAEALCKNTALIELDISRNDIGESAGESLAEALCKNTTLTYLNLYRNNMGELAGKALAEALCKNTTLTGLNISWNYLGESSKKALVEAQRRNVFLKNFKLLV